MHHVPEPRNASTRAANILLLVILVAVIEWGVAHAIGAYRFNADPMRGAAVLACTAAFVGLWIAALAARSRRLSRQRKGSDPLKHESHESPPQNESATEPKEDSNTGCGRNPTDV
jgi:hypothetical protein